jgi:hypothetical protein
MKKKVTPFAYARVDAMASRAPNATESKKASYPSFAEILGASDLRALVRRASARVLGPAVVASAVGLGACSSASELYSDLIAPPAPTEQPIEMRELPKPSTPVPHVGPVAVEPVTVEAQPIEPQPIEPCPLPPDSNTGGTHTSTPSNHPPIAPGGIRPVHPTYAMPGGAG